MYEKNIFAWLIRERKNSQSILSLEDSPTGYPALDLTRSKAVHYINSDVDYREKMAVFLVLDEDLWKKIEEEYGIEVIDSSFSGNCEDYTYFLGLTPKKVLKEKKWLERSVVDVSLIPKSGLYIVIYWSDESSVFEKAVEAGFIRVDDRTTNMNNRLVPSHVGYMRDGRVTSKLSLSGPVICHDINQVPKSFGSVVTLHKVK